MTFKDDLTLERVKEIPPELLSSLSPIGRCDMEAWTRLVPSMLSFSRETWYVRYRNDPLLAIGAVRLCLLDPAREMFMYGSVHLHWAMLPPLREMFREWLAMETGPIYARANSPTRAKYMKFFGFRHSHTDEGVEVYEVLG